MNDFQNAAQQFLREAAEKDRAYYVPSWDVTRCGRCFPLQQHMEVRSRHAVLGINCGLGKEGVGAEYSYFLVQESLDGQALKAAFALTAQLAEEVTNSYDRQHDYTFISLVILTARFNDLKLKRMIRRFRLMRRFHQAEGQYGWNACRMCIIDLLDGSVTTSALGQPLEARLLKGRETAKPQRKSFSFPFFNHFIK